MDTQSSQSKTTTVHDTLLKSMSSFSENIIAIGTELLHAQEICPPELFEQWLNENFQIDRTMATRFMDAARQHDISVFFE